MVDGFTEERIDVGSATLRVRHAGARPAVLLLHGRPRTSATWHRVAPQLIAAGFTVVCPDLRGYRRSSKPPTTADHSPYSKREMAADMAWVAPRSDTNETGQTEWARVGEYSSCAFTKFDARSSAAPASSRSPA